MSGQYIIVSKVKDASVKAALSKALSDDGRLSTDDVRHILRSTFDDKSISLQEFEDIKTIVREAKTLNEDSHKLIAWFQRRTYAHYLTAQAEKKKLDIPYKIDHIPTTSKVRPGIALTPLYLTIHSTANPNSTAANERGWLTNPQNTRSASYHIVVDQKEAIECIPLNEQAWHSGTVNGNGKSIGLEICESGNRSVALTNGISVAAKILRDRRWGADKLKRHFDWSGKNCPRILIDSSAREKQDQDWDWFKTEVGDRI